jgi:hypothetical protein
MFRPPKAEYAAAALMKGLTPISVNQSRSLSETGAGLHPSVVARSAEAGNNVAASFRKALRLGT